ncbi:MAG: SMP-30/gluconolactonase/LRE family protein [Puniceicoccaceae bacterium]
MENPEILSARVARWGEGPVWHGGRLHYVDIENHLILRLDPVSGAEEVWDVGQRVGFVVPCRSGRLLYGGDNGLFFLDPVSGGSTFIADPEPGRAANRFNDGKCSPDGRLFAGTMATDKKTGAARLYRLDPDRSLAEAHGPVTNSNGLAWSADGRTCYYIDTPTRVVTAFDYDPADGRLSRARTVIDCSEEEGVPDGMTIDAGDHLWIAFCHGGNVARFDPATGRAVLRIPLPTRETTSCAFGGGHGNDLFITTGVDKNAGEGDPGGRIFVIRGMAVAGRPADVFAG